MKHHIIAPAPLPSRTIERKSVVLDGFAPETKPDAQFSGTIGVVGRAEALHGSVSCQYNPPAFPCYPLLLP
jgi:hypothetical protein